MVRKPARDVRMTLRMTKALREGLERAAERDRRILSDFIVSALEDVVAASDAKAKSGK